MISSNEFIELPKLKSKIKEEKIEIYVFDIKKQNKTGLKYLKTVHTYFCFGYYLATKYY